MGREVRRVPADWQHPKAFNHHRQCDEFVPLHEGRGGEYVARAVEWDEGYAKWQEGLCKSYGDGDPWKPIDEEDRHTRFTDYDGPRPSPDDYMPDWPEEQATHLMMYEDTTEGTPISPPFATPEELARWLADTGASALGDDGATYEQWLSVARGGWAPSMVMSDGRLMSGVEFMAETETEK